VKSAIAGHTLPPKPPVPEDERSEEDGRQQYEVYRLRQLEIIRRHRERRYQT
jgi:hypothetical protein